MVINPNYLWRIISFLDGHFYYGCQQQRAHKQGGVNVNISEKELHCVARLLQGLIYRQ